MLRFDFSNILPGQSVAVRDGEAPTQRGPRRRARITLDRHVWVALLCCLGSVGGVLLWHAQLRARDAKLVRAIAAEVADSVALAGNVQAALAVRYEDSLYTAHVRAVQQLDAGRFVWPHVMADLSAALPAGVWLLKVSEASGGIAPVIRLDGAALGVEPITAFLANLQQSVRFGTPRFVAAEPETATQSTTFRIEVPYRDPTGMLAASRPGSAPHAPPPTGGLPTAGIR